MFITELFPSIQNSDYYILHENLQNNFVSKQKKMQFKVSYKLLVGNFRIKSLKMF